MTFKTILLLPAALALLAPTVLSTPVSANPLTKHPKMAGLAAGLAVHHMAKKGAKGKMAHGMRPNMAQRHPLATGLGAAAMTHHMLKK